MNQILEQVINRNDTWRGHHSHLQGPRLSANSAHGPALDGRTIPHMVAPGCSLDTTKAETFEELRTDYAKLRDSTWGGYSGYDAWFERGLNNAHLAAVGAYRELVPVLQARLAATSGDLERFFSGLEPLAKLDRSERLSR